jgi:hypothetical protein
LIFQARFKKIGFKMMKLACQPVTTIPCSYAMLVLMELGTQAFCLISTGFKKMKIVCQQVTSMAGSSGSCGLCQDWQTFLSRLINSVNPDKEPHSLPLHSRKIQNLAALDIWRGTMLSPASFDACMLANAQRFL